MARLSQEWKEQEQQYKFIRHGKNGHLQSVRQRNRCTCCGRPRGFLRKFKLCRLCFRKFALRGEIPGVIKSSW